MGHAFYSGELKKISAKKRNKWVSASYTIEAALLVPFILFFILSAIQAGFLLYDQEVEMTEIREEIQKIDPVKTVRNNTWLQEAGDLIFQKDS